MQHLLLAALLAPGILTAGTAAEFGQALRESSFDRDQCYRVRDLTVFKEDVRIYLSDGHLIFTKPVAGHRLAAVFTTDVEGGDGEVVILPPNRAERTALAGFSGSPNMDEHFHTALFVFTGPEYDALVAQFPRNPANRKAPEVAEALDLRWTPAIRTVADNFETRLALDVLGGEAARPGLFAAMLQSTRLGGFDVLFDPYGQEQVVVGALAPKNGQVHFDTWASFEARAFRRNPPPRHEYIAVSDYRIQAKLTPDLALDCVTRVKVKPLVDGVRAVAFDMSPRMAAGAATVNGQAAEVLQRESPRVNVGQGGNEMFLVFPPDPLRAGQVYEFEIHHSGKVIDDAGGNVYTVAARGNWYPAHNLQFAQFDLEFRYPADLDLVAAGAVVSDRTEGEWRVTRRRTPAPIRFAAFNLGHYRHAHVSSAGYLLDVCANKTLEDALTPPPTLTLQPAGRSRPTAMVEVQPARSPADRLQSVAAGVMSSVEFMASRFGPPALPQITVTPIPGNFGQGFPGLIYLSTMAYLEDQRIPRGTIAEPVKLFFDELLQAHEVAHQWWGNRVTSTTYRDGWLMEALANISAVLYLEQRKGTRSAEVMFDSYRANLLEKRANGQTVESFGPLTFGPRLDSSQEPSAYRDITYGKGTWVMQMLRRRMGDERFVAMLRELLKRYDHRDISNDEFRRLAAEFLPSKLEDAQLETFFDQWVYGAGIPTIKLSYTLTGKAPALRLAGTIAQSDVAPDFSTLAPVEIHLAGGQTITQWVRTSGETSNFTVALERAPLKVTLDPHYAVLRRQ